MSALAAASSSDSGNWLGTLIFALPILLLGFMFWSYFKRQRQFQRSQATLAVGEEVGTTSGLHGTLTELDDEIAVLEIADGVRVRFDRRAVVPRRNLERTRTKRPAGDTHTDTKA